MFLLNKEISFLKDKFFGLDISDTSVKVLQLEKRGAHNWIRSCGFSRVAEGSIDDGMILDRDSVAWSVKNAIAKAGPNKINTKKVVCALPESKVFSRIIGIPEIDAKSADEAIKWEIEANIPLSVEQVYYDWQFLENEIQGEKREKKQNVLTAAVSKGMVDNLMDVIKLAGLEAYVLEPESIADARSLVDYNGSRKEISVIVDLGFRKTILVIAEGNVPCFTSGIPFTSEGVTDLIAKHFGIGEKEAEELKSQQTNTRYDEKNSILAIADSLLENLVSGIEKSIDFYFSSIRKTTGQADRIILVGGGSNLRGLPEFLSKRLSKTVEIGNPLANLNLHESSPLIEKSIASSYSTVAGLALRGLHYGNDKA